MQSNCLIISEGKADVLFSSLFHQPLSDPLQKDCLIDVQAPNPPSTCTIEREAMDFTVPVLSVEMMSQTGDPKRSPTLNKVVE